MEQLEQRGTSFPSHASLLVLASVLFALPASFEIFAALPIPGYAGCSPDPLGDTFHSNRSQLVEYESRLDVERPS